MKAKTTIAFLQLLILSVWTLSREKERSCKLVAASRTLLEINYTLRFYSPASKLFRNTNFKFEIKI